jgi:hypothetical protein
MSLTATVGSLLLPMFFAASVSDCGGQSCKHNADCKFTGSGKSCVPDELTCDNGQCTSQCRERCQTAVSDVNACGGQLVCNDNGLPSAHSTPGFCTGLPIPCTSAAECPLYRPPDSTGMQAQWACTGGICIYPGFNYVQGTL